MDLQQVIELDLEKELAFRAHKDSIEGLAVELQKRGWSELVPEFGEDAVVSYDALYASFNSEENASTRRSSLLQFYFDVYDLDDEESGSSDILIQYLDGTGTLRRDFNLFQVDSFGDVDFFMDAVIGKPALIFCGNFQPFYASNRLQARARKKSQRTLNALCIDVDAHNAELSRAPLDPSIAPILLQRLSPALMPSYISLSGNGLHLWYAFDKQTQTFGLYNPRRVKFQALYNALGMYVSRCLEGLDAEVDFNCTRLNHGFRAPGSLSKYGDLVRLFCKTNQIMRKSTLSPIALSELLNEELGDEYPESLLVCEDDVIRKNYEQLEADAFARRVEFENSPATNAQVECIERLLGYIPDSLTKAKASRIIEEENSRRHHKGTPQRPAWRTRPHRLVSGKNGGVYSTIFGRITEVEVGRRYMSLFMLAGVAYMMTNPQKTRESLRNDLIGLLSTDWARQGVPLNERDVENALKGYREDNWRTKDSIIDTLGFDPFNGPAKRNGNSREEHLAMIARPSYALKSHDAKVASIRSALEKNPCISKSEASRITGISYPTVLKYWDEAFSTIN